MSIWKILEIPHGSDRDAIRRAYAKKLRLTNPEDDPEGFKTLRAAYETALRHLEYQPWHDVDNADEAADENEDVITATEPHAWNEPQPGTRHDPRQSVEPELDAMLAAREAELDALRAAMAELEKSLRGPWRPDDSALVGQLDAILRSPALAEIRIRTDVEPWLADLLAETIPHSDAVLLQAIQAFGWLDGDRRRGFNPAIAVVLDRLDEWRLIEGLNRPSHVHHAAWRSLTHPPGPWWRWRLAAFKPGMIAGIEIFLGIRGEVARGLRYSYRKESVERWQRFLAKPRMTLGILALMPLAFLGLLALGTLISNTSTADSPLFIGGMSAIAFAMPFAVLFLLSRWRQRWRERFDHPRLGSDGWLTGCFALPFIAMALPPPYWPALVALPAIGIAIWAYIVAPPADAGSLRPGRGAALCVGMACLIFLTLPRLDPAEIFALGVVASLLAYLRLGLWPAVGTLLARTFWWQREWMIFGVTTAAFGAALGTVLLRATWSPVAPIYPFALAAAALLPIVGAPGPGAGRSHSIARVALLLVFLSAFGASLPESRTASPTSTAPVMMSGADDIEIRTDNGMAVLERDQPGFAQLREGNPALYARIRAVMKRFTIDEIKRDEASRQIDTLVNDAYFRMLPDADSGLLIEGLRLRLDRLQALRQTAPALCKDDSAAALPKDLRDRQNLQTFKVVSSPAAEATPGRIVGGDILLARAAAAQRVDRAIFLERFEGRKGTDAACAARIAITQALLDSDRVDDIAATLRDQYRRSRYTKRPAAKSADS
ncbi:MAG: hypothetical protein ABI810_00330 [Sphingomonas bacterium]